MTREEAIEYNKNLRMYMELSDKNEHYKFLEENYIALDMAIKALEQTDKIEESNFSSEQYKADLQCAYDCGYNCGYAEAIGDILAEENNND